MYRNILVPLDSSETAARGLREAIGLAQGLKARLVLLHVVDGVALMVDMSATFSSAEMLTALQREGSDLLALAREKATAADVESDSSLREIQGGGVADAIVDEARLRHCDLIVMGTHGRRGLRHLVLGSDAEEVVRRSAVPVLLVRDAVAV